MFAYMIDEMYVYCFVFMAKYFRYLPAKKLLDLTDKALNVFEDKDGLDQLGRFLAIKLRMDGNLYTPIVWWLEYYDDEFVKLQQVDDPTTPINVLKKLSQTLPMFRFHDGYDYYSWSDVESFHWYKNELA